MIGLRKSSEEKRQLVDEYLKKYNPYEKQPTLNFDLRKYARFVEQNNLKRDQITEAVMEQFVVNKT